MAYPNNAGEAAERVSPETVRSAAPLLGQMQVEGEDGTEEDDRAERAVGRRRAQVDLEAILAVDSLLGRGRRGVSPRR